MQNLHHKWTPYCLNRGRELLEATNPSKASLDQRKEELAKLSKVTGPWGALGNEFACRGYNTLAIECYCHVVRRNPHRYSRAALRVNRLLKQSHEENAPYLKEEVVVTNLVLRLSIPDLISFATCRKSLYKTFRSERMVGLLNRRLAREFICQSDTPWKLFILKAQGKLKKPGSVCHAVDGLYKALVQAIPCAEMGLCEPSQFSRDRDRNEEKVVNWRLPSGAQLRWSRPKQIPNGTPFSSGQLSYLWQRRVLHTISGVRECLVPPSEFADGKILWQEKPHREVSLDSPKNCALFWDPAIRCTARFECGYWLGNGTRWTQTGTVEPMPGELGPTVHTYLVEEADTQQFDVYRALREDAVLTIEGCTSCRPTSNCRGFRN